jgi:hypothetical protein
MRKSILLTVSVMILTIALAAPAVASPKEAFHITDHRVGAEFNNTEGRGSIQIYAVWYSPNSSTGDSWFVPESHVYVTYWGDRIGDDCTIPSQRMDDWSMKWSQNHGYVAFDSECGFFELYVRGEKGVEPDHDWSHYNGYWNGRHHVRSSQWNDAGTTAELYLDGQLLDVVLSGAGLSRTSGSIIR